MTAHGNNDASQIKGIECLFVFNFIVLLKVTICLLISLIQAESAHPLENFSTKQFLHTGVQKGIL